MARGGKLSSSLKSMLRKWKSSSSSVTTTSSSRSSINNNNNNNNIILSASSSNRSDGDVEDSLQTVYVGKSRRRYLISSHLVDHPLFRELADKSSSSSSSSPSSGAEGLTVGCEVVLFEHLLWMLENADPQPDSIKDLVQFYTC